MRREKLTYGRAVLAVARIDLGVNIREYVKSIEETLDHVSNKVSALLVSPPVMPLYDVLKGRRRYTSYKNNLNNLLTKVSSVARRKGITVMLSPVLRRAGNKLYLMNVIIPPIGAPVFRGRGLIPLTPEISSSPDYEVLTIDGVNLCFSILNDIEVPEVFRICLFRKGDAVVAVNPPLLTRRNPDLTLYMAMVRARENKIPIIGVGGYAEGGNVQQPTFIIRSDGRIAEISDTPEPNIFEIEVPATGRLLNPDLARKYIKIVKEHILREMHSPEF